jgi:hypothetical protein
LNWHTSTYSTGTNNCVEVADDSAVTVRDTKDHGAGVVTVSRTAWSLFIEHIA